MDSEAVREEQIGNAQNGLQEQLTQSRQESIDQMGKSIDPTAKVMQSMTVTTKGKNPVENPTAEPRYGVNIQNKQNTVTSEKHQYDNTSIPVDHHEQGGFVTFTNPLFLDINNSIQRETLKFGSSKQPGLVKAHEIRTKLIEERLEAVEGGQSLNQFDAKELCLVPDLILPPKFKVPVFEKFDGTSCPKEHIIMYCRMMTVYANDDKLLIHCFQDSLTGSAIRWYNRLNRSDVQSWRQLVQAFMEQYKYMLDMAPDRLTLQNLVMKDTESFREYAQRWMDLASQVQPPLTKKERSMLFVSTLPEPYYEKLVASSTKDFTDVVVSGEMIENAVKKRRIDMEGTESISRNEEILIDDAPYQEYSAYVQDYPIYSATPRLLINYSTTHGLTIEPNSQPKNRDINKTRGKRDRNRVLTIPMPYAELLPQLIENDILTPLKLEPLRPPYPSWYDANERCDYHSGNPGHSTENCTNLKYKVRDLIKNGTLKFNNNGEPILRPQ